MKEKKQNPFRQMLKIDNPYIILFYTELEPVILEKFNEQNIINLTEEEFKTKLNHIFDEDFVQNLYEGYLYQLLPGNEEFIHVDQGISRLPENIFIESIKSLLYDNIYRG